jgi:hypothetical protein
MPRRRKLRSDAIEDDPLPEEIEADELLKEIEAHMGEDPGERVTNITFAKNVKHVFSLKIGADELDEIADAAEAEGVSIGLYIREAALARARKEQQPSVDELKAKVRELSEAVERL